MRSITDLVPDLGDLPGDGWRLVELGTTGPAPGGADEVIDCVGADFPRPEEVVESASSAHYVRRRQLVHGLAVRFTGGAAADRAARCLRRSAFAECLARSLAADLTADDSGREVIEVRVAEGDPPHRVSFTAARGDEVLTVHLDLVVLVSGPIVCVVWFGDAPQPVELAERDHVVTRLAARLDDLGD